MVGDGPGTTVGRLTQGDGSVMVPADVKGHLVARVGGRKHLGLSSNFTSQTVADQQSRAVRSQMVSRDVPIFTSVIPRVSTTARPASRFFSALRLFHRIIPANIGRLGPSSRVTRIIFLANRPHRLIPAIWSSKKCWARSRLWQAKTGKRAIRCRRRRRFRLQFRLVLHASSSLGIGSDLQWDPGA